MMRILIVEKDKAMAGFIRRGLESEGYRADVLEQPAAAEILIRQRAYGLLILDLATAGHDGVHLLRWTEQTRTVAAVLALTDGAAQLQRMGAADCLAKPFSFAELSARVRILLRPSWSGCAQEVGA